MPDKKKSWLWAPICAAVLLYAGAELYFGCPIRRLTGVPCPGCGMTRAVLACLRGEPQLAFWLHPLFFLPVPLVVGGGLLLFCKKRWIRRASVAVLALCVFALVAVYAVRLAAGTIP